MTSESILNFITRAWADVSTAVLVCQATLVIATSFGGGVFITWNRTPYYWKWLQEISVFTQASRAIIMNVNIDMEYRCNTPPPFYQCAPIGFPVQCDGFKAEDYCLVSGRRMLNGIQGTIESESPWVPLGYLFLIFVVTRLGVLVLMFYSSEHMIAMVKAFFSTGIQDQIIEVQLRNRCIEGNLFEGVKTCIPKQSAFSPSPLPHTSSPIPHIFLSSFSFLRYVSSVEQLAAMTEQLHRDGTTPTHLQPGDLKTQASLSRDIDHYENYNMDDLFEENFRPPPRPVTAESVEHPHCLVWKNLSLTLNKCGSVLIDNVSGAVCAGRVLALMGPSGAGKTTLLNALGNRAPYGTVTGEITFGRRDFGPGDLYYVPQFDEVNGTLTLYRSEERRVGKECW